MSRDYQMDAAPRPVKPLDETQVTERPSLAELLANASKELESRRTLYPHLVHRGTMTYREALHGIACQREIVRRLTDLLLINEAFDTGHLYPNQAAVRAAVERLKEKYKTR